MLRVLRILFAAGLAVVGYAVAIERNWFALRRHQVPCLPAGARPLRMLHISDLHLRKGQRRKQAFLRRLDRLDPDFIVGTGDFLGDDSSADAAASAMSAIGFGTAAFFVLGSNDYHGPKPKNPFRYFMKHRTLAPSGAGRMNRWEDLVTALEKSGWTFLNNRTTSVDGVEVVGLDDAHIGRADMAVASARAPESGFRLAVAHSPDSARDLAALGYDLIVCGHTHGGQICIPGVGALVTNCSLPRHMARGVHRLDGAWLHVCGGLGTSMYAPYRLACRPEVCLLELVARDADPPSAAPRGRW